MKSAVLCSNRPAALANSRLVASPVVPTVKPVRGVLVVRCSATPAPSQPENRPNVAARAAATEAPAAKGPASKPQPLGPHVASTLAELDTPKSDPKRKLMVAQVAPAVRVAIAEPFGLEPGATSAGQLAEGLKRMGFDFVFDTLFAADLTIMEEATELLHRLKEHLQAHPADDEPLPMFTSCCPGWIGMMEKSYPDLIPYVSSCKSPQMMMGAVVKTYLAQKLNVPPSNISMVSVMPCVRKQGEADREWMCVSEPGVRDVDHVITTAELAQVFKDRSINLPELPEGEFDIPIGSGSGGGVIFGTTGGVMEAALRTAFEVVTQTKMDRLEMGEVRGMDGIKEAQVHLVPPADSPLAKLVAERAKFKAEVQAKAGGPIQWDGGFSTEDEKGGLTLRVAVANGLGNAKKLLTKMQAGESKYDFVEIMACPAGCVGGGGQPRSADKQITQKRQAALYTLDERSAIRRSHENQQVQQLYNDFLGEPLSHRAHELLHTHYVAGGVENE